MPIQPHTQSDVVNVLELLQDHLIAGDPALLGSLEGSAASQGTSVAAMQSSLTTSVQNAISFVKGEAYQQGEDFHSRHPLAGLAQAHLSGAANTAATPIGDELPCEVVPFGESNPIVWAPVMVNILIEYMKPKAAFQTATDARSFKTIPDRCTIALLGDWGADNDHAKRIAAQVKARNPTLAIHLGDIYYAGSEYETQRFLANWPFGPNPPAGTSYALNGNHEMYSLGIPYFGTLLPAFGQEASYFTLANDNWQLHGMDTAYVPFSINGDVPATKPGVLQRVLGAIGSVFTGHENFELTPDARLQTQWKWLQDKITAAPAKKNILLSHNQPVSAYLPEFEAGAFLCDQFRQLRQTIPAGENAVLAWFFGHEHKCTIYRDDKTDFRARLIGNGAIPHSRQTQVGAAEDETGAGCTPPYAMNDGIIANDILDIPGLALAISGFALLTLDGPNATVDYINEDGSLFLRENLTGTPNQVLQWGKGYGPVASAAQ
jgi:hypothetical protein